MVYPYKRLFQTALITSPLMGVSGMFPMRFNADAGISNFFVKFISIVLVLFILWMINIAILKLLENQPKQYLRFVVSITFTLIIAIAISLLIDPPPPPPSHSIIANHHFPDMPLKVKMFFPLFSAQSNNLVILFIIELIISKAKEKTVLNENTELKIKNLEAQQIQLKQQIHPHFLFNSLNTLKSLIGNHPNEAEEYLVKLSSFLRYNLNSNTQDLILLKDELKICTDYLEIQKVRFKEALQYSIEINRQDALNSNVPIFAIQLLIENAIKHNILTFEDQLHIEVRITNENKISISNNLQEKFQPENSMKIGLKNLSERYKLLIKKDIQIIKTEDKFEVLLPLA
jgi:two-component system LytT family sensor kinase